MNQKLKTLLRKVDRESLFGMIIHRYIDRDFDRLKILLKNHYNESPGETEKAIGTEAVELLKKAAG